MKVFVEMQPIEMGYSYSDVMQMLQGNKWDII